MPIRVSLFGRMSLLRVIGEFSWQLADAELQFVSQGGKRAEAGGNSQSVVTVRVNDSALKRS